MWTPISVSPWATRLRPLSTTLTTTMTAARPNWSPPADRAVPKSGRSAWGETQHRAPAMSLPCRTFFAPKEFPCVRVRTWHVALADGASLIRPTACLRWRAGARPTRADVAPGTFMVMVGLHRKVRRATFDCRRRAPGDSVADIKIFGSDRPDAF